MKPITKEEMQVEWIVNQKIIEQGKASANKTA